MSCILSNKSMNNLDMSSGALTIMAPTGVQLESHFLVCEHSFVAEMSSNSLIVSTARENTH